ncbi:FmdB family zinc ribbon protein [Microbacterium sp. AG238]|jgi:putative FmdB family regulatory protein|uniref:FmdB family zinc ribbon protein n=1 Tax=Microbacterium sp. AG238 TaxID=2183994 RepID=UPI000E75925D|nr:FmdB family zinc ribbon protein [Microbacterium sp. AG238]RKE60592.1 putative FmdB family regulatory protein [Microbacterium sp. AG238]
MPTYAYACKSCGHRFDAVQSFADPALTVCPECSGELRKQYGTIGVTFNGGGFYRTDSRASGSGSGSGSSTSTGSGDSSTSASSKSEAKSSPAAAGS